MFHKIFHTHSVKKYDKQFVFSAAFSDNFDSESKITYSHNSENNKEKEYMYDDFHNYKVKNNKREVRIH